MRPWGLSLGGFGCWWATVDEHGRRDCTSLQRHNGLSNWSRFCQAPADASMLARMRAMLARSFSRQLLVEGHAGEHMQIEEQLV